MSDVIGTGLKLSDSQGNEVITADTSQNILFFKKGNENKILLYGNNGQIIVRGSIIIDAKGSGLLIKGDQGKNIRFLTEKSENLPGSFPVMPDTIQLNASDASIIAGGSEHEGQLILNDKNYKPIFKIDGQTAQLLLNDKSNKLAIRLDAEEALLGAGGSKREGQLILNDKNYKPRIKLDSADASVITGGSGISGKVIVRDSNYHDKVTIDGESGDIILTNADCAEDFEVIENEKIEPGMVMALNDSGQLQPSISPYDKRVVGVVSGAGNLQPGLILGRKKDLKNRIPIALAGTVHCKVDASYEPIDIGDLLTSSGTLGHAMKASDSRLSFGAVIGKAMSRISHGTGFIPILIALQ